MAGMKILKSLLVIYNSIFALMGIVSIAIGVKSLSDMNSYNSIDNQPSNIPMILIVTGVVIFLISFFGCFGAISEKPLFLKVFSAFLIVLLLMEIAAVILIFVYQKNVKEGIEEGLMKSIKESTVDNMRAWDSIQTNFKCCGVHNAEDWEENSFFRNLEGRKPGSCCGEMIYVFCDDDKVDNIHKDGCYDKLYQVLKKAGKTIAIVVTLIAVIEVSGIVMAMFLVMKIKKDEPPPPQRPPTQVFVNDSA